MDSKKELGPLTNCALCANMCKHSCPTYLASGSETVTPQKIARLILYEEKALIEDEQGFFDVMFRSAMCGACKVHCIYGDYDLRKFILMGRSKAFEAGVLPEETRKRVEKFREFGNPNGERDLLDKGVGDTGYFVSCSAYNDPDLLRAMDRLVSASGEQVRQFGGADLCCGAPLYYAGDMAGFKKAARKMKQEIGDRDLRRVVAGCPNCIKMMTEGYSEVGAALDVEVVHASEFLRDLLAEEKIRVGRAHGTVTYHDPCILVNDSGVAAAPREVLEALGYEIREPVYSGKDTHCCGAVCGARIGDCGLTNAVTSMRIGELRQTEADIYVTACPTCKSVLSEVGMKDIAELVSELIIND